MSPLIIYSFVVTLCIHGDVVWGRQPGPFVPVLPDDVIEGHPVGSYGSKGFGLPIGRSCSTSSECMSTRFPSCCRDSTGNLIDADTGRQGQLLLIDPSRRGRCSLRKGGPGENCNNTCGCRKGYVCHRPLTGMCCPPKTCWTKEEAEKEINHWKNCHPPDCQFPA